VTIMPGQHDIVTGVLFVQIKVLISPN